MPRNRAKRDAKNSRSAERGCSSVPVSYTHLDVYKRQEYVLRYILTENGVDPDNDVTLDFYSEATEALAQLQAGTSTIAMLPQPFVTSALAQVEGLRVALDMNEEWEKVAGSKLVTGVLVARKDAVEADPARFAAFMDGYKASVEAANTDLENTAALCEQYGIVAKAALAQNCLLYTSRCV